VEDRDGRRRPVSMKAAAVLLVLLVSAATLAGMSSASLGPSPTSQAALPIATVVQHGGLCFRGRERPGTECRSTVTITDRWISAPCASRSASRYSSGEDAAVLGVGDRASHDPRVAAGHGGRRPSGHGHQQSGCRPRSTTSRPSSDETGAPTRPRQRHERCAR
jgi:hypothetical protein